SPGAAPGTNQPAPKVVEFARQAQSKPGELAQNRGKLEDKKADALSNLPASASKGGGTDDGRILALKEAGAKKKVYDEDRNALIYRRQDAVQSGKLGVDRSVEANNLRNQSCLTQTALRQAAGRNCLEYGGFWIDEEFDAKMPAVTVKAQSAA